MQQSQISHSFTVSEFKSIIPQKVGPWLILLLVLIYQASSGVYMHMLTEMKSSTALMQEDVLMAGFSGLLGMSICFVWMFRLKFRFQLRFILLLCSSVIIVGNLVCMNTVNVPLLVGMSFITGFFRMFAIFGCNSTLHNWIAPNHNMALWFCFIMLQVETMMEISSIHCIWISDLIKWEYVHWSIIGLHLVIIIFVFGTMCNKPDMRPMPLFGIDWFGGFMWAALLECYLFIIIYGHHYDWYESWQIRIATGMGLVVLFLTLWRASFIRHPYYEFGVLKHPHVKKIVLLYILMGLMLSPEFVVERAYIEILLHEDAVTVHSLNWFVVLGEVLGTALAFGLFAKRQWSYKIMAIIAFVGLTLYAVQFYFAVDYNLSKEALYLPLMCRGFGRVICAICFITSFSQHIQPFPRFVQTIGINGIASAVLSGSLGATFMYEIFVHVMNKNFMLLSSSLDHVNPLASSIPVGQLYGLVQQQAMMVSFKEIYGWLSLFGITLVVLFLFYISDTRPAVLHPKFSTIRRMMRKDLKK